MILRLDSAPFYIDPCCIIREHVIDLIPFNGWAIAYVNVRLLESLSIVDRIANHSICKR